MSRESQFTNDETSSRLDQMAKMAGLDPNSEGEMLLLVYDSGGVIIASLGEEILMMADGLLLRKDPKQKGFTVSRSAGDCAVRVVADKRTGDSIFATFHGQEVDFSPNGTATVRVGRSKDKPKRKKRGYRA